MYTFVCNDTDIILFIIKEKYKFTEIVEYLKK